MIEIITRDGKITDIKLDGKRICAQRITLTVEDEDLAQIEWVDIDGGEPIPRLINAPYTIVDERLRNMTPVMVYVPTLDCP